MSAADVQQAPATLGRVVTRAAPSTSIRGRFLSQIWRDRIMLVLIAPGVIYFLLFRYVPLLGNVIAFQDYLPFLGFDSPWVGLDNFAKLFSDPDVGTAIQNTL